VRQADLFSARGELPVNLAGAQQRQKETHVPLVGVGAAKRN